MKTLYLRHRDGRTRGICHASKDILKSIGSSQFSNEDLRKLKERGFILLFESVEFIPYQGFKVSYTTTKGQEQ